jgi:hypothetical protein
MGDPVRMKSLFIDEHYKIEDSGKKARCQFVDAGGKVQ